jgi:hypothetical protein
MGLLAAPQSEVKMGQVLIIDAPITRLPIGFAEHPTIGIFGDGDMAKLFARAATALTQVRRDRRSLSEDEPR